MGSCSGMCMLACLEVCPASTQVDEEEAQYAQKAPGYGAHEVKVRASGAVLAKVQCRCGEGIEAAGK